MRLTFLGTSAGAPTRTRNVTSHALTLDDGAIWLLDCAEATQHRFLLAGLRPKSVERILITHLHGDHCYGLPGMLACLGIHQRREPIQISGPRGLREMVLTTLRLSDMHPPFRIDWAECETGRASELPLLASENAAQDERRRGRWTVSAHPLVHRVPCFGYCLAEAPRQGRFKPETARALGIPEGPLWGRLQRGEFVHVAGTEFRPEQVSEPPRRGRKLLLLGDTCDADAMLEAGQGADLVVREATYDDSRLEKARKWQHSTARMSGEFAHALHARELILTHLSARFTGETSNADPAEDGEGGRVIDLDQLKIEAESACPGTRVLLADDLWTHEIPASDEPAG